MAINISSLTLLAWALPMSSTPLNINAIGALLLNLATRPACHASMDAFQLKAHPLRPTAGCISSPAKNQSNTTSLNLSRYLNETSDTTHHCPYHPRRRLHPRCHPLYRNGYSRC